MSTRLLILTLFFGTFVANLNNFAISPFVAEVANDIDRSVSLVGQTITVSLLAGALIGLIVGPVGDHYGLRRTVAAGAVILALSAIGTALASGYWTLLLARVPAGLAGGMLLGLGTSLAATRLAGEDERRGAMAWVTSAGALAAIAGVPLLAVLADFTGWRTGFWVLGVLGLALTWAYLWVVTPDPPVPARSFRPLDALRAYQDVLRDRVSMLLQAANLFWAVAWMGVLSYFGAFLTRTHEFSLQQVGYMYMWGGAFFFLGNRLTRPLLRVTSPTLLLVAANLVLSISTAAYLGLPVGVLGVVLLLALSATAGGVGLPLIVIMVSEAASGGQGTAMMFRIFTWFLGSALGTAIGGVMIALGGYPLMGVTLAGLALLSGLAALLSSRVGATRPATPAVGGE